MASRAFKIQEHVLPGQHIRQYHRATVEGRDDVLNLSIKQYTPLDNTSPMPGDVTIIAAQANGFPKELYEPLWTELLARAKRSGFSIRHIFMADVVHQGISSVLNEEKLGDDPSWFDHSRDLLHLINHFRDDIQRPLIGVGHSMGGCQIAHLSILHPRLFAGVILLDPVIQRLATASGNYAPARASSFRRDIWPSRKAAAEAFKKSKFYQTWDPRVLDLWIQYGLRDLPTLLHPLTDAKEVPDTTASKIEPATTEPSLAPTPSPPVTLMTPKHQEVFMYLRPKYVDEVPDRISHPDLTPNARPEDPFYRPEPYLTFHNLQYLRPAVLYIFGETSFLSSSDLRDDKIVNTGVGIGGSGGVAEGKVKEVVLANVGHLVPMEDVRGTADSAAPWIGEVIEQWTKDEKAALRSWEGRTKEQRMQLSEKYLEAVNGPMRGIPAGKLRIKKNSKL